MNFEANIVLKEDYTFLVADGDGQLRGGEKGLYSRDTRFLSMYHWDFGEEFERLLGASPDGRSYITHHARMRGDNQTIAVYRRLQVTGDGLEEILTVENTGPDRETASLRLRTEADFTDVFALRGLFSRSDRGAAALDHTAGGISYRYDAADGLSFRVDISLEPAPDAIRDGEIVYRPDLEPGASSTVRSTVRLAAPFPGENGKDVISYRDWRASFGVEQADGTQSADHRRVVRKAIDDLRALLLFTPQGPVPAAGIPWYGAVFGRDALIAAYMLLPHNTEVPLGTLQYLAAHQGEKHDNFRGEEPGRILHEMRFGELSRTGVAPHHPYYGTIDATPLFIIVLDELFSVTGDSGPIVAMKRQWEAALSWMRSAGDPDGDGFLEYGCTSEEGQLVPQSWKDSADSMSHADGSLARGPVAPSEVQGYAYRAYRSAARFYDILGDTGQSDHWKREADLLQSRFHEAFWQEDLGIYAMALDGEKRPLRVMNSNAGHVLETGIAEERVLPALVDAFFSPALWTGWGIRSLGSAEKRYNPVSYHNGSVWPHDSAFIAGGLEKYGYHREAVRIRRALFELAESQSDKRLPELVAGYPRSPEAPPVAYPVACRPQAWGSATVMYLLHHVPDD